MSSNTGSPMQVPVVIETQNKLNSGKTENTTGGGFKPIKETIEGVDPNVNWPSVFDLKLCKDMTTVLEHLKLVNESIDCHNMSTPVSSNDFLNEMIHRIKFMSNKMQELISKFETESEKVAFVL